MLLYRAYAAAIFSPCHPYIWSTTVLHDKENTNGKLTERAPLKDTNKRTALEMAKQEVL